MASPICNLSQGIHNLEGAITLPLCVLSQTVIPILIAIEVIIFIVAVIRFLMQADSEAEQAKAKRIVLWGIVALFVTVALWGLVGVIQSTTGIGAGGEVRPVQLNETSNL